MKGFFAIFEGVDGAGKGTMLKLARNFLVKQGIPVERILCTTEPTKGYYGRKLRELLKHEVRPEVNASQFLDLYVADRREHLEKEVLPALGQGKIVLCDRYKYSTFVYQPLQGVSLEKIRAMHEGMAVPDIVFILDVPAEAALKRISRRLSKDVFEKIAFMEKVRSGFLGLKEIFPHENIVFVDALKGIPEVSSELNKKLLEKLHATAGN